MISLSNRDCQTPHHLSCSDLGRAQNAGPTESAPLRTTRVPEPERLGHGRCKQHRAGHGWFPVEQPRAWAVWSGRLHAPWAGADPVWLRHCEHTPVLFVCSVPPSPQRDWTSEPKKKKKSFLHRPLCVRAETRHWRDQQTEEVLTEGNALEATGNRLKPRGYYVLHRKGPIDLEKYKSDQGTSQKWTEPTILTTNPKKVLDIFLLFLRSFFFSLFFF